ncbi:MAG: M50 family metallopeptidase [Alicyclobacillus herbarius]|uniref:M50 family metallopeptidase n=1 Tax=Alicyclobacillus herbarius TaxID=122960 RepID=UPI00047869BC|nr:M50 family metallopeptidase [Alicyclobacillus herbarius]MCL6631622.1 M50 family metallopeptidase [Alicyclobacillus herbarius]
MSTPSWGILTRIRLHPLFLCMLVLAASLGFWEDMVLLFILVMLHELGHAIVADALGYEVEEVSLLPFGGVARLAYGHLGFVPRDEALIAVAGPVVNVLLILLSYGLHLCGLWSEAFVSHVVRLNVWIAVFNLLPGLPLDGGRILRAARAREIGFEQATREAYRIAMLLTVALLLVGGVSVWAGMPHIGMLFLAVFLGLAVWSGIKGSGVETVRFLDAKRKGKRSRPQEIRSFASPATSTVRDVVRRFSPDHYHMVYVLDDSGQVVTIVEEEELLEAVFQGRWLDPLDVWVKRID